MSISSIAASPPVNRPVASPPNAPAQPNANANDTRASQPPLPAPLPPGQGMRLNQLV
jgi:hypothetical protein